MHCGGGVIQCSEVMQMVVVVGGGSDRHNALCMLLWVEAVVIKMSGVRELTHCVGVGGIKPRHIVIIVVEMLLLLICNVGIKTTPQGLHGVIWAIIMREWARIKCPHATHNNNRLVVILFIFT